MASLFFSYSHRDEAFRDDLEIHLAGLKRQGLIESWHDRRILAGDEFAGAISEHLEHADLILLLVSPYFIASDYCYDIEMQRAMERHESRVARVIPVILEPCDWHHMPFGKLLAVPKDGRPVSKYPNRHEAFLEVVQAVRQALAPPSSPRAGELPIRPDQAALSASVAPEIRSSNLRVKKSFTDHDRDMFLDAAFEYIANYFEGSLVELGRRNPALTTSFKRLDAEHFSAVIYRNGSAATQCRIWIGSPGFSQSRGIYYSSSAGGSDNSFNESLSIDDDEQSLILVPLGMIQMGHGRKDGLSQQGGAEHLWSILMRPLQ